MLNELKAITEPGERLIALAEEHAADFATRAAQHDREGSFPYENLDALKQSGYLYAPIPVEAGGLGVESPHDVLVASSRLARGDASLTLGVNMHLVTLMSFTRQWRMALNREDRDRAAVLYGTLAGFVRNRMVIGAAISEPDQSLTRQQTRARRDEAGWVIDGRKIISSMAPATTHFIVSLSYVDDDGGERYAYALVPSDAPGVRVHDDWDAMGMRASASTTVTFENVRLPGRGPGRGAPAGIISSEYLEQTLNAGPAHASSSLGIAEAAYHAAIGAVASKRARRGDAAVRPTITHLAAENSIDIAAARAIFGRAMAMVDEYYGTHPTQLGTVEEAAEVFAEVQRAKAFINQAAVRIVDRAMTITGGAAYMTAHPLSRLYRDARAGAFMHPLGANVAYEFIGSVALGVTPRDL